MTTKIVNAKTLVATPLIGLALIGAGIGAAGIANAAPLTDGNTVSMTIFNNTNQTMNLQDAETSSGDFVYVPQQSLAPHTSEVVTASSSDASGFAVTVSYGLPDSSSVATFKANDNQSGANTDGTGVTGQFANVFSINSNVVAGFPSMNATYTLG